MPKKKDVSTLPLEDQEVIKDYRLAYQSRQVSLIGRREVLSGKAKFGIFGDGKVNAARFAEAKATGAETIAVGCPFCMTMLTDASKADGGSIQVKDVAEIVAERLK